MYVRTKKEETPHGLNKSVRGNEATVSVQMNVLLKNFI